MKKVLLLLLTLLLCAGLIACNQTGNPDETTIDPNLELAIVNIRAMSYCLDKGEYRGVVVAEITTPTAGEYTFASKLNGDTVITLKAGNNTVYVPCSFKYLPETPTMNVKVTLTGTNGEGSLQQTCMVAFTNEEISVDFTLPGYRNNFYPGQDHTKVAGKVPADKNITLTIEGGGIALQETTPDANGSFSFDTADLTVGGEAVLTVYVDGVPTLTKTIRRLETRKQTMTWIENGTLVVDGEPVIRRNIYSPTYHVSQPNRDKYFADDLHESDAFVQVSLQLESFPGASTAGHETTMDVYPSEDTLKRIDQVIANNKMHNFGYYYLSDEPEFRNFSKVYMQYVYEYIAEKDPYHVVLIASNNPGEYVECADWIETDPYISPKITENGREYGKPMNTLRKYVAQVAELNRADKCIGIITLCSGGWPGWAGQIEDYKKDYPTFDEYICNAWTGLCNGAKSVWPYAGHDLHDRAQMYEGSRYVFSSIEALEDLLATGKRTVLKQTSTMEAVMWSTGSEQMFVVLSLVNEEQTVTIDKLTGTWDNFRHEGTITGNTFTLRPFEAVIGTSVARDEGIPSYNETVDLINAWEAERKQSKSLFFDMWKFHDYNFKSSIRSMAHPADHKLFDGVLDNYAWKENGAMTHYLEIEMKDKEVTASKIVVHGDNLATLKFLVRYDGELVEPSIADMQFTDDSVTIWLSKAITPDSFYFEFNDPLGSNITLYEIEAF